MLRLCVGLLAALAVASAAPADDAKHAPKLSGAWVREADGGVEITLNFKSKDELAATAKLGDATIDAGCKYAVEKDGTVKVTVTSISTKGELPEKPAPGLMFEFKFKIDGKTATLSEFKLADMEGAKEVMEGEYKAKKLDK